MSIRNAIIKKSERKKNNQMYIISEIIRMWNIQFFFIIRLGNSRHLYMELILSLCLRENCNSSSV